MNEIYDKLLRELALQEENGQLNKDLSAESYQKMCNILRIRHFEQLAELSALNSALSRIENLIYIDDHAQKLLTKTLFSEIEILQKKIVIGYLNDQLS